MTLYESCLAYFRKQNALPQLVALEPLFPGCSTSNTPSWATKFSVVPFKRLSLPSPAMPPLDSHQARIEALVPRRFPVTCSTPVRHDTIVTRSGDRFAHWSQVGQVWLAF